MINSTSRHVRRKKLNGRKSGSPSAERSKSNERDGLKFLGEQIYSVQEDLNRKADKLYKGTVLIDRARTRDLAASKTIKTKSVPAARA